MKVLVIMGSPRKGNTYRAVKRIEEVMQSKGEVEFEYLLLSTTGATGLKDILDYMQLVASVWGFEVTHKVGIVTPPHGNTKEERDCKRTKTEKSSYYILRCPHEKRAQLTWA